MARVQYINGFSRTRTVEGYSRQRVQGFSRTKVNAEYMGEGVNGFSRTGTINGANDLTSRELAELLTDIEDGDTIAINGCQSINGIRDWFRKRKEAVQSWQEKRQEKKSARQQKRQTRRDQKAEMRQARIDRKRAIIEKIRAKAQQLGKGEGFGAKIVDLAKNWLGGEQNRPQLESGLRELDMSFEDLGGLLPVDPADEKGLFSKPKFPSKKWFEKNSPWSYVGVIGGSAVVLYGGYKIYQNMQNKPKRRR